MDLTPGWPLSDNKLIIFVLFSPCMRLYVAVTWSACPDITQAQFLRDSLSVTWEWRHEGMV